jgi:hypothetical protein
MLNVKVIGKIGLNPFYRREWMTNCGDQRTRK